MTNITTMISKSELRQTIEYQHIWMSGEVVNILMYLAQTEARVGHNHSMPGTWCANVYSALFSFYR